MIFSLISLNTGAQLTAPSPPSSFRMTTAYFGFSAGNQPANHALYISPSSPLLPVWAVAVLPAALTSSLCARLPLPFETTSASYCESFSAVAGEIICRFSV